MRGAQAERTDGLDRHLRVGERVADSLMADDRRRAPAHLRLCKIQRTVEGRTHQPDGKDADDWRGAGEARFDECLAPAARPEQVIGVRAYVVQPELRLQMRAVADVINRAVEHAALPPAADRDN